MCIRDSGSACHPEFFTLTDRPEWSPPGAFQGLPPKALSFPLAFPAGEGAPCPGAPLAPPARFAERFSGASGGA
eukprot:1594740-Alexandrium_andersonii.AAC.1